MSQTPRTRLVHKIHALLRKKYDPPGRRPSLTVLEQVVLAVLSEGTTTAAADAVFHKLKTEYFDWNEVRVSSIAELQEALASLPDRAQRAIRLKACLKYVFESDYSFDVDHYRKLTQKEAVRRLEKLPQSSPYLAARVIRDGLGGNAVPLDAPAIRALTRLGLIDAKNPPDAVAASLERTIPRVRQFEFCHLLAELAADTCVEAEPNCKPCCLVEMCPAGQQRLAELKAAAESAKRGSRRSKAATKG